MTATALMAYVDATLSNTYAVIDLATKAEVAGWPSLSIGTLQSCAFSPDGTRLAVVGSSSPYLKVIDVATKTVESGWPGTLPGVRRGVAWSPDGSRLACFGDATPNLNVIDVASKTIESGWAAAASGPNHHGRVLDWSPDGSRLVICNAFSTNGYEVYDTSTKSVEAGWPATTQQFTNHAQFSPDGTKLALTSAAGGRRLYVIVVSTKTSDTAYPSFTAASNDARGLSWSPGSDRLAVGRVGSAGVNHLQVIDVASKTAESSWPAGNSNLDALSFSPDGVYLAAGYSTGATFDEIITVATKTDYAPPFSGTPSGSAATDFSWAASLVTGGVRVRGFLVYS